MDLEDLQIALSTCSVCGAEHREGRVLGLLVGHKRIITGVVTPEDSTPAQEGADVIFCACSRRCEKQIEKLVPRALRDLEESLASELEGGARTRQG